MRRLLAGLLAVMALTDCKCMTRSLDDAFNGVDRSNAVPVSERARAEHLTIPVVDLHSDALLWSRSLLERTDIGHVDLPRMLEGGMALQVFGVVTRTPLLINFTANPDIVDSISMLSRVDGWPEAALSSPLERARFQAGKLHDAAKQSRGTLTVITNQRQLDEHLAAWRVDHHRTAGMLALEGGYPVEGNPDNLQPLFDAGVRMIGLSHFLDSDLGGSAHGWRKGGLTPLGQKVVERMEQMGITVDIAHAAPALIDDLLPVVTRPIVVSHTGVKGVCPGVRNISDAHVQGVARTGGVVGIGFFKAAVCGISVKSVVDGILYVRALVGVQHVSLGSDFDGMVKTGVDASQLAEITQELLARGLTHDEVYAIMGGNALRVLRGNLPP